KPWAEQVKGDTGWSVEERTEGVVKN
ncbi:hypothetical protein CCACVL1_04615, partial [Corchorus capsularis]